jgi:hypothetical protein
MTTWDEDAERQLRGLPSKREQHFYGLAPEQEAQYADLVQARRKRREVIRQERQAWEAEGTEVINSLGEFGVASSYELRAGEPVIGLGLEEAQALVRTLRRMVSAYGKALDIGSELAQYAAYLDSRESPGQEADRT